MKRKAAALFLAVTMAVVSIAGCGSREEAKKGQKEVIQEEQETAEKAKSESEENSEPVDMNITALKGPTAMGMVQFMDQAEQGALTDENYHFSISASADEVTPKLVQGKTDVAAVPANLASVLYNKTNGQVQVLAVNTLGVLYLVENGNSVQSAADLKGKTIYASGKGSTPEYALDYILRQNNIDPEKDVTIEWKSEHSECVAAILTGENSIAMLPQPFVTTVQTKNPSIRIALDLTEEWEKVQEKEEKKSSMITGVVVARTVFVKENPEAVEHFLEHYEDSVEYVNGNTEEAAQLVGKYDIVPPQIAQKALPECNIVYIDGEDMKEQLSGYLEVLKNQNPQAVGGVVPQDDFYYTE